MMHIDELPERLKLARTYYNIHYYQHCDLAHQVNHMDEVYIRMCDINSRYGLGLKKEVMFFCAYIHDLFTGIDRKNHHTLAKEYVLYSGDPFIESLYPHDRQYISIAVSQHRASSDNNKTFNDYSKVLRIADKGKPDFIDIITRFALANPKLDLTDTNSVKHLRVKYGKGGYLYNDLEYVAHYGNLINELHEEFEKHSDDNLLTILKGIINK